MDNEKTEEKVQKIIERLNIDKKPSLNATAPADEFETVREPEFFEFGSEFVPTEANVPSVKPERTVENNGVKTMRYYVEAKNFQEREFVIPDAFDAAERSTEPEMKVNSNIYTTYVPRFTEVSENYRMVNDPRPRNKIMSAEV